MFCPCLKGLGRNGDSSPTSSPTASPHPSLQSSIPPRQNPMLKNNNYTPDPNFQLQSQQQQRYQQRNQQNPNQQQQQRLSVTNRDLAHRLLKLPSRLSSYAEIKLNFSVWKSIFIEVVSPGWIRLTRDERDGRSDVLPAIPLPLCLDIVIHTSKKKNNKKNNNAFGRLDIHIADKQYDVIKLRFPTAEDAVEWQSGLCKWQEYSIEYVKIVGKLDPPPPTWI